MGRAGRGMAVGAAVAGGVMAGGVVAGRAIASRLLSGWTGGTDGARVDRWHAVTVNRPVEEVAPDGRLPDRLMELGDGVEVQVRPAPGGKGTELLVRLRDGEPVGPGARLGASDPRWGVRRALRETRSLLETGEVLRPTKPPTTEPTPVNAPLRTATAHGREEGML